MSYCRWSSICENGKKSDLYMYDDVYGGITGYWIGWDIFHVNSRSEAIQKVKEGIAKGKNIPEYVLQILEEDLLELGETEGLIYDGKFI